MLSVIKKQKYLNDVFKKYPMISEVYANKDFDLFKESGTFIILAKQNFNAPSLLEQMQRAFDLNIEFYVIYDPRSELLKHNFRIIWKAEKWYV